MKKLYSLRWILFTVALVAIVGIAGMNIYYITKLQENAQSISNENKKERVEEFASEIRGQFLMVPRDLWKVNMSVIEDAVSNDRPFPPQFLSILQKTLANPLYTSIYFVKPDQDPCNGSTVQRLMANGEFQPTLNVPEVVCDGIGLARTRMKVLLGDYKWNTKTIFDTHRSMNITMINPENRNITGYLSVLIDREYLLDNVINPKLAEAFGDNSSEGVTVWIYDWVRGEVLATNNSGVDYDRKKIDYFEGFNDMFDNWSIRADVQKDAQYAGIENNLAMNLTILIVAVLILLGSLVFFLVSAQKERELAVRQSSFLSNVTHELKTPLAVIQAAGENLRDGRVTNAGRQSSYGKHIYDEAIRLKQMINKMLDVARSDAKQLEARRSPQQIDNLIQEYLDNHRDYIESKGFTLHEDLKTNNAICQVDPEHISIIVENLIENAIKYSQDTKEITVQTCLRRDKLELVVKDSGIGIPDENVDHIFDKFYRVEDTLTAETKGHGLGLAIVKNLVELNDGSIEVRSTYQQGSTFIITFPVEVTTPSDSKGKRSLASLTDRSKQNNKKETSYVVQG